MFYFLEGEVLIKKEKFLVLKVQGIGFKIFCLKEDLEKIKISQIFKIFVFLKIKENETIELYGFLKEEQLNLFEVLNKISGIGPKTAFDLSYAGSLENLKKLLESEDKNFLARIKGVGRKRIQKIFLEISGEIKKFEKNRSNIEYDNDALSALISLGFARKKALEALLEVEKNRQIGDTETRIKTCLKILGKKSIQQ